MQFERPNHLTRHNGTGNNYSFQLDSTRLFVVVSVVVMVVAAIVYNSNSLH